MSHCYPDLLFRLGLSFRNIMRERLKESINILMGVTNVPFFIWIYFFVTSHEYAQRYASEITYHKNVIICM